MGKIKSQLPADAVNVLADLIVSKGAEISGLGAEHLCKDCDVQRVSARVNGLRVQILIRYVISNSQNSDQLYRLPMIQN